MKQNETLIAINDGVFQPDLGPGRNPPGIVMAANEQRFTAAHYQEPLTAYAVGWRDPENLEMLLDDLFPGVQVGRRFEFKSATNAEAFLAETNSDDIRQIGASFKRVEYKGSSVTDKTLNKGLTIRIDHDDTIGDGWREQAVERLKMRLLRSEIIRGIAILAANDTNANKSWTTSAGNPDGDLRDMTVAGGDSAGLDNNIIILGKTAWNARASCYEAANTPYAGVAAGLTPDGLAAKLGVDKVRVVKPRYQSAAATKTAVLGLLVYGYFAEANMSKDDPSSVKRFWTPTDAGKFRVFMQEFDKFTDISVEHYSNIICTSTVGIRQLTISAS